MAHLYFLMREPGQADRVLVWDTRTLSIGRSPENDVTIADDEISRKHALLIHEGGVFEIGDYRTGNGTFVNEHRVSQKQRIKPGDVISIGKLQLEFRQGEEHPAKLGHKLEFASQLKTAGMLPQGADAGTTMLGLADTTAPGDEFVIEPERSSGGQAFLAGGDDLDQFQMRELGESLDQMDVGFDDGLELVDLVDPPRASEPPPPALDPNAQTAPGGDPTERLRKLKMLHDEGLITDAEFQAKRTDILNEM
jgi:predicted component of type VI protein secretion system